MDNITFEIPINGLSFGQIAITNVLYPAFLAGYEPNIFPIGEVDISCYTYVKPEFKDWLIHCAKKAHSLHKRSTPTLKLWHLSEGIKSFSDNTTLLTFHETDRLTPAEANIVKNYRKILVTSQYTKSVFDKESDNTVVFKPAFDSNSFKTTNRKYFNDNVISFGLAGKLENRKRHIDVIKYWAEKYGNNRNYVLNCALSNRHLSQEAHSHFIGEALGGKNYFNINFNPFMNDNAAYNDYLNSNHIILGMSVAEGFGLPEFQSIALGKHGVILNATGYQSWANKENACLVESDGPTECYDNVFFRKGGEFNQGNFASWNKDAFYAGIDSALARYSSNKVNSDGLKLQSEFSINGAFKAIIDAVIS